VGLANVQLRMNLEIHACSSSEFRVGCKTIEDVKKFVEILSEESHVTWRVLKTDPRDRSAGIKNLFCKEYRCQSSNLGIEAETNKPHKKHTDCGAQMRITLKRIGQRKTR